MQAANAQKHNDSETILRAVRAGRFASRTAFARAEYLPAMRMRQHAKQADAGKAAL